MEAEREAAVQQARALLQAQSVSNSFLEVGTDRMKMEMASDADVRSMHVASLVAELQAIGAVHAVLLQDRSRYQQALSGGVTDEARVLYLHNLNSLDQHIRAAEHRQLLIQAMIALRQRPRTVASPRHQSRRSSVQPAQQPRMATATESSVRKSHTRRQTTHVTPQRTAATSVVQQRSAATIPPSPATIPPSPATNRSDHELSTLTQNIKRLSVLKRRLQQMKMFDAAVDELTSWCTDHRAFIPELETGLTSCLLTVRQWAGHGGFNIDKAVKLYKTCMQHNKHMSKELAVSIQKWLLATESVRVSFQRLAARNIPHEELVAAIEKLPVVGPARTYPADTPMLLFQLDGYLVRPFQLPHAFSSSKVNFSIAACLQAVLQTRSDLLLTLKAFHMHDKSRRPVWPDGLKVSVNSFSLQPKLGKGIDMRECCHVGSNLVVLTVPDCACSFLFSIHLEQALPLPLLRTNTLKQIISVDESMGQLMKLFETDDDDIAQTSVKLSLRCPLTKRRIVNPVRGKQCMHAQCFDMDSFFELNLRHPHWVCPVCNKPVPPQDLHLDGFFKDMLSGTAEAIETVEHVTIDTDGNIEYMTSKSGASASQVNTSARHAMDADMETTPVSEGADTRTRPATEDADTRETHKKQRTNSIEGGQATTTGSAASENAPLGSPM